jgi:hypothetical protein
MWFPCPDLTCPKVSHFNEDEEGVARVTQKSPSRLIWAKISSIAALSLMLAQGAHAETLQGALTKAYEK